MVVLNFIMNLIIYSSKLQLFDIVIPNSLYIYIYIYIYMVSFYPRLDYCLKMFPEVLSPLKGREEE